MKKNKTIIQLIDRANNRNDGYAKLSRQGEIVYEVVAERKSFKPSQIVDLGHVKLERIIKVFRLYHYETLICHVELDTTVRDQPVLNREIVKIYGESKSDADAINTMLDYLGFKGETYTFRPVNGGFQKIS